MGVMCLRFVYRRKKSAKSCGLMLCRGVCRGITAYLLFHLLIVSRHNPLGNRMLMLISFSSLNAAISE